MAMQTNNANARSTGNALAGLKLTDMAKIGNIANAILPQAEPLLAKIREDNAKLTDASNAADEAGTHRGTLWHDTLAVAELVRDATEDAPSLRAIIYSEVMGEFLGSETRNTAKAYASTAKSVLIKLWTDGDVSVDDVKAANYGEVRAMLRPAGNPQADADAESIRKMVGFIKRFADKYGVGDAKAENAVTRLARIKDAIEPEYNAVKSEKDRQSQAAKAARELKGLQQQAPTEAGTVETVKPEALPQQRAA
jgi:hypothetical protein